MKIAATRATAPVAVLQLVDTLSVGGLERMARDLANLLPRERFHLHLCTTRATGPLADGLANDVDTLLLTRRYRYDVFALMRLARWIRRRDIRLVHAHGHAVHAAIAATAMNPRAAVVWHLHSGAWAKIRSPNLPMRIAARRVAHIFTVTEALADWCRRQLRVASDQVEYLPNFLAPAAVAREAATPASIASRAADADPAYDLPGEPGKRLICVANLRPEKDLPNVLEAMRLAVQEDTRLHLLLVGSGRDTARRALEQAIRDAGLTAQVTTLGHRADVAALLRASDAAILGSCSEGFPLVLLEYGAAGLPTVATRVGQCADILDHGQAGILAAAGEPAALASAILRIVEPASRHFGERLRQRVATRYAAASTLERIASRYLHLMQLAETGQVES